MLTNSSYDPHGTYLSGSTFFFISPRRSQKTTIKFVIFVTGVKPTSCYFFITSLTDHFLVKVLVYICFNVIWYAYIFSNIFRFRDQGSGIRHHLTDCTNLTNFPFFANITNLTILKLSKYSETQILICKEKNPA